MRLMKWIARVVLFFGIVLWAQYLNRTRTYSIEQMSEFLAMCGTFIQTGFSNNRPDTWDYFVVLLSAMVVIATLWYSIKFLVRPSEKDDHIKFKILEDEKAH